MKRILVVLVALVLVCLGANAQKKGSQNHVVGFYNLENLFDIYDDPVKNDSEFLPAEPFGILRRISRFNLSFVPRS